MNETIRVQLIFPLAEVKKPVIWHFAHDFGLMFSIRRAQIDVNTGGYTVLDLTGPKEKIDAALQWARREGVEASFLGTTGAEEWVI
jgi:ABC-type methionine transport system ATPase subunit